MKKIVFMFAIAGLLLSSCGKYDEGPGFTLKSKTSRLCREWEIDKVFENGIDITSIYNGMFSGHKVKYMKEFSIKETIGGTELAKAWEWGDKKETITVEWTLLGITTTQTYTILRLTSKEYWYTVTVDGKDYQYNWKAV